MSELRDKFTAARRASKKASVLDPDLALYKGRQYPLGKNTFGIFADSSPDRWGRVLMQRREKFLADKEGRKPRKLLDSDYLLGVYDETRMGAIRFSLEDGGTTLGHFAGSGRSRPSV